MSADPKKRFRVGISFAGEKRDYVAKVAAILAARFGEAAILYDRYHEAEFARRDLGFYLPNLYLKDTELIVVVVCADYEKEWPGLEWDAIFNLLKQRKNDEVMLLRFDRALVNGLYSTAGFVELDDKPPEQAAALIVERLELNESRFTDADSNKKRNTESDDSAAGTPTSPTHKERPPKPPLVASVVSAAVVALVALALFFWDPLRISEMRTTLDDWYQRFYSAEYPSAADKHVAVVLIDRPTLDEWGTDWPVPYDYLVGIIYRLSCAPAAAVFFDLIPVSRFADPEGQTRLAGAVIDSSEIGEICPDGSRPARIPVFFGALQNNVESPLLKELGSGQGRLFNVETSAAPGIYPVGREPFPGHPVQDDEVTPAFGLLRRLCAADNAVEPPARPGYCSSGGAVNSNRPLALRWSAKISSDQDAIYPTRDCLSVPDFWGRLAFSVYQWNESRYLPCPPVLSMPANVLISGNIRTAQPGTDAVLDLMKDRIVLIGVDLPGSQDTVATPIHGRLPGVFFHAMALDNLLTYDDGYPTEPNTAYLVLLLVPLFLSLELARSILPRFVAYRLGAEKSGKVYLAPLSAGLVTSYAIIPNLLFDASWSVQFILFIVVLKGLVYYCPSSFAARFLTARLARQV